MSPYFRILPMLWLGALSTGTLRADDTDLQALKKQLQDMQAAMQTMQAQIQTQQKTIETLQRASTTSPPPLPITKANDAAASDALFPTTDDTVVVSGMTPPLIPTTDSTVVTTASSEPSPNAPISVASSGKSFLNLSFDGQFSAAASSTDHLDNLQASDHDPQQNGFNARNLEIAIDGAVDPYFEGYANLVFKLDNHAETAAEFEEAFLQTTSLGHGLQVKAGQFFAPLGRINSQHPHAWDFVDGPLMNGRLMGADGLRGVGAQVSWVAPLPWYSQVIMAVQNGSGGTGYAFRNPGEDGTFMGRTTIDRPIDSIQDYVFVARWENSFDINANNTVLAGVSAAFGPNDTGPSARTQTYAADLFYKWKPANAEGGWPFVKWQTEAMLRKFEAGRGADNSFPFEENFDDWGLYSQVVWGFKKGWDFGLRGDYLHMQDSKSDEDPLRQSRARVSSVLTWHLSEFSKLRLQYNHDFLHATPFLEAGDEDSVFLQFEFTLGAHGAHKF